MTSLLHAMASLRCRLSIHFYTTHGIPCTECPAKLSEHKVWHWLPYPPADSDMVALVKFFIQLNLFILKTATKHFSI